MEYLSENNVSKYNHNVSFDISYQLVKTNKKYNNVDELNKQMTILDIYQYSNNDIINIIDYCKKNDFIESINNNQYLYFGDYCKCIGDTDITYFKEFNLVNSVNDDYVDYINMKSNVKMFNVPSLNHYDINVQRNSLVYTFITSVANFIENKEEDIIIAIELFDNKCFLNVVIGRNQKLYNVEVIEKKLKEIAKLMKIDVDIVKNIKGIKDKI